MLGVEDLSCLHIFKPKLFQLRNEIFDPQSQHTRQVCHTDILGQNNGRRFGLFHSSCLLRFLAETLLLFLINKAVLHIVLSHHGTLENGSPVVPATREATLVHMLDNLGGRLGSFDRIERALREGESWSRFDPGIESAAYFVVAEALTNVAKYAQAENVLVDLSRVGDEVIVVIEDDGVGGADIETGTGLRGLVDRLSALDGSLELEIPEGGGTRLIARIPCAVDDLIPEESDEREMKR